MDMDKLVSIIIPVYNTDTYIEECIKSVCNQEYSNLQIIVVDDGSTDSSIKICEKLQKEDGRIKIIKNIHKGAVYTRKCGVENAIGEYVAFVDSDDYVDKKLIGRLLKHMDEDVDMVSSNMYAFSINTEVIMGSSLPHGTYEKEQWYGNFNKLIYNEEANTWGLFQSLSGKLFRRNKLWEIIREENDEISLGDDAAVVYPYALESDKIILTDDCLYHYRVNETSMTHTLEVNVFQKIYDFMKYMQIKIQEYPDEWQLDKQLHKYMFHFLQNSILSVYGIKIGIAYSIERRFKKKDRIALYGVGGVGKSLFNILNNEVDKIILYDKSKAGQIYKNRIILSPNDINQDDFDYIIIAIKNEETARKITKVLLNQGVSKNKICWETPKLIADMYTIDC